MHALPVQYTLLLYPDIRSARQPSPAALAGFGKLDMTFYFRNERPGGRVFHGGDAKLKNK